MAKGIIYIMTTSVNGLIKIGKTDNFNKRMTFLEQNGYWNVSGLKRFYAVRVDNYDKKEKLIHTMFSKSQVANSELFALDKHIAQELLESFGGEQVYPELESRTISQSKKKTQSTAATRIITCHMGRRIKAWNNKIPNAKMEVRDGKFIVLAGSELSPVEMDSVNSGTKKRRSEANIRSNNLKKDEVFDSPSAASVFVCNCADNGWTSWLLENGEQLQTIRNTI